MTVRAPLVECPKCQKQEFGVLMVGADRYVRRCKACLHQATLKLPSLKKTIIYLDQNAISDMMKAITPTTRAYQQGKVAPFWSEMLERLVSLIRLQAVVCPQSEAHLDESLMSPFYQELKRMYENLSGGVSFTDHDTILRFQIVIQCRKWMGAKTWREIQLKDIIHGEPYGWRSDIDIRVTTNLDYSRFIPELRTEKAELAKASAPIHDRRKGETGKKFNDWYAEELWGTGQGILESYVRQQREDIRAAMGLIPAEPLRFPNSATAIVTNLWDEMLGNGFKEEDFMSSLVTFLGSAEFKEAPTVRIGAMLSAAMARRFAAGRQKPPSPGFSTDVDTISSLLPYCDVMFVDNECRNLLSENPVAKMITYGTKIYSLATRDAFLEHLDNLKDAISHDQVAKVQEVYGAR